MLKAVKIKKYFIVLYVLAMLFLSGITAIKFKNHSRIEHDTKTISVNGKNINVYIADSESKRSKGLSIFESISDDQGMLFTFEKADIYFFWMMNMSFDIDIIWINGGRIVEINKKIPAQIGAESEDLIRYFPPSPADMVLEVNAGWTDKYNIKVGDTVKF